MDKPIIFSAPMVQALLAGRKTQTRRIGKVRKGVTAADLEWDGPVGTIRTGRIARDHIAVPYAPGDRLYVREAMHWTDNLRFVADDGVVDFDRMPEGFTAGRSHVSGMFMPRWASRLTLTVTEVRVQRLQEISAEDADAEGIETDLWDMAPVARRYGTESGWFIGWPIDDIKGDSVSVPAEEVERRSYASLWNSLHGPDAWADNPWICAISFTVQHGNIDSL
jgi:hypothetical protein